MRYRKGWQESLSHIARYGEVDSELVVYERLSKMTFDELLCWAMEIRRIAVNRQPKPDYEKSNDAAK